MRRHNLHIVRILRTFFLFMILPVVLANCQPSQKNIATESATSTGTETRTPTPFIPTRTCIKTPSPSLTPTETAEGLCIGSGDPESFEPSAVPEALMQSELALLQQTSFYTETDLLQFESVGSYPYGTETRLHSTCHDKIPSPDLLSNCMWERETSRKNATTGDILGIHEIFKNESLIRGLEIWVRPEGGSWYHTGTLEESEGENALEDFKISPFYYDIKEKCEMENEYLEFILFCFKVNIPGFFMAVFREELHHVDCVMENEGAVWIDPLTHLPKQWSVSFNAVVTFKIYNDHTKPFNERVKMQQTYMAFNKPFTYPNPK